MPLDSEARLARRVGASLGEGPVWIERDRTLRFVDIKQHRVYRFDPASGALSCAVAPEQPGFVLPLRAAGFLVGCKNGLYRFSDESGAFEHLAQVEPHAPGNRLNDACVGPDGALWFGSMDDGETELSGALYRCGADARPSALDGNICITNGPAFTADGSTFYHTDTLNRTVYAFDHAGEGKLTNKRVFVRIAAADGWPDGTVVDREGGVWIALWGGWCARRYSPQGELLSTVRFPVANVTKLAFGGADFRTAYATTASKGLSDAERAQQPLAGDLFTFRAAVPGFASPEAAL